MITMQVFESNDMPSEVLKVFLDLIGETCDEYILWETGEDWPSSDKLAIDSNILDTWLRTQTDELERVVLIAR